MHRAALMLLLLTMPPMAFAGTITGIFSERSAAGAQALLDEAPGHEVWLRTAGQLARLSEPDVVNTWADADGVFLTGSMDKAEHNGLGFRRALNGLLASGHRLLPKRRPPNREPNPAGSSGSRIQTAVICGRSGYAGIDPAYRSAATPLAKAQP